MNTFKTFAPIVGAAIVGFLSWLSALALQGLGVWLLVGLISGFTVAFQPLQGVGVVLLVAWLASKFQGPRGETGLMGPRGEPGVPGPAGLDADEMARRAAYEARLDELRKPLA